jgi:hypothetical protein
MEENTSSAGDEIAYWQDGRGRVQCGEMEHRHTPNTEQLSLLAATILLAYALARLVNFPERELGFQLPGLYVSFLLNAHTAAALLVAGLTASGADWLLRQHPHARGRRFTEHWMLPGLTAWVIGLPLFQIKESLYWMAGYLAGGVLLMLVMVAEYITIDEEDTRHPAASVGLTAVSFALFLILAMAVRYQGMRLFLMLPAVMLSGGLVSLRTLHLRLHGRWAFNLAGVVALCCGQLAAAFHYLPLQPAAFGLLVVGPAYSLTSLLGSLAEGKPLRSALVEPLIVAAVFLGAAIWYR